MDHLYFDGQHLYVPVGVDSGKPYLRPCPTAREAAIYPMTPPEKKPSYKRGSISNPTPVAPPAYAPAEAIPSTELKR